VEAVCEPSRLGVGDLAESTGDATSYYALLVADGANLETRVLGSLEDFMAVEAVEEFGGVLSSNVGVEEDSGTTRMEVDEAGEVEDFGIDDDPL